MAALARTLVLPEANPVCALSAQSGPSEGTRTRRERGWAARPRSARQNLCAEVLGESFRLALRIASPYVIYALVVNLALALVNRLTPQVQVFFVATPFVAAGGLLLLYFTIKPAIEAFISGFGVWLISG